MYKSKTSERVRWSTTRPPAKKKKKNSPSPPQTVGISVKYGRLIGTRCVGVWCKQKSFLFFFLSLSESLSLSRFQILFDLRSLPTLFHFRWKQIQPALNKQQLCTDDKIIANGSITFFTLTFVFLGWICLSFIWLDFLFYHFSSDVFFFFSSTLFDSSFHIFFTPAVGQRSD